MTSPKKRFTSVAEYIATFPEQTQQQLQQLRTTIRAAAPEAQEAISYQIAAFKLNGKDLIYFAGWKMHISIYPIPSGDDLQKEIAPYVDGKGTLKFPLDRPLPLALITKIVKRRVAENREMKSVNY